MNYGCIVRVVSCTIGALRLTHLKESTGEKQLSFKEKAVAH